jgi:hypothetical protein
LAQELLCNRCKETKPTTEFFRESKFKRGFRYACKDCERPARATHRKKPENIKRATESRRRWVRKTLYNFPQELYEQRLEEQGNVCAICGTDNPGGRGQFHADHDHVKNQPRGVLCHNCNVALGNFKDNPEILRAAVEYLERWNYALGQ